MKKAICYFGFSLLALSFFGQKTISSTDFGSIGDQIILGEDTNYVGDLNLGEPAANAVWEYDFLQEDKLDTVEFIDPATTASGALGGSNVVMRYNIIDNYWKSSPTELQITAFGFEFNFGFIDPNDSVRTIFIEYSPGIQHATLDMEYEDVNTSSATGTYVLELDSFPLDSANGLYISKGRLIDNVTVVDSINGFGTVYLANDTLDCLRQDLAITHTFKIEVLVPIGPIELWLPLSDYIDLPVPPVKEHYVRYWARRQNFAVIEFTLDSNNQATSTKFLSNIQDYVDSKAPKIASSKVSIYPIPAANKINVKSNALINHVSISDYLGKQINVPVTRISTKSISINTSSLSNGFYTLDIDGDKRKVLIRH